MDRIECFGDDCDNTTNIIVTENDDNNNNNNSRNNNDSDNNLCCKSTFVQRNLTNEIRVEEIERSENGDKNCENAIDSIGSDPNQNGSNFLVLLFLMHGIGALLPWNMLIDGVDYFEYKLNQSEHHQHHRNQNHLLFVNNQSNRNTSNIEENMFSYISIASKAPNILLQALNIWFTLNRSFKSYSDSMNHSQSFLMKFLNGCSLTYRIQISLIIQIVLFLILILFACIETESWSENLVFLYIILCTIGLNMANGIYQSCIYGSAARIPQLRYTNAITIGMSLSGTITSLLNIGSIAISPSPKTEIIVFFSFAAIILGVCFGIEYYYVNHFCSKQSDDNLLCITLIDDQNDSIDGDIETSSDRLVDYDNLLNSSTHQNKRPDKWQLYIFTIIDIWPHLINIFLVYFLTFTLFPAVVANIHPANDQSHRRFMPIDPKYFTPVYCFFAVNFFTSIGNFLAEKFPLSNDPLRLISLAILRFLMIPFFLFNNYLPPTAKRTRLPVWFDQDWIFLAGIIVLALGAGYLSSLSMMYAPKSVRKRQDTTVRDEQLRIEAAGMITALTVIIGILIGANSSLIYPLLI